jgi:hypothetical protein
MVIEVESTTKQSIYQLFEGCGKGIANTGLEAIKIILNI